MAYKPDFAILQNYYRTLDMHPDGDYPSCAIRMSMALSRVGVYDAATYKRSGRATSPNGWALRAEQLYQWLRTRSVLGEARLIHVTIDDYQTTLPLTHGIVYLRDCWRRQGETEKHRSGDHIDLYYLESGYPRIMTATLWPEHCAVGLLVTCRDGQIRYWDCV